MPASTAQRHDEQHALLRSARQRRRRRRTAAPARTATAARCLAAGAQDWASHGLGADARAAIRNPGRRRSRGECWLDAPAGQLIGWRDPRRTRCCAASPARRRCCSAGDAGLLASGGGRGRQPRRDGGGCANAASLRRRPGGGRPVRGQRAGGGHRCRRAQCRARRRRRHPGGTRHWPDIAYRRGIARCWNAWRPTAPWSASTCPARSREASISPAATASRPGSAWARW